MYIYNFIPYQTPLEIKIVSQQPSTVQITRITLTIIKRAVSELISPTFRFLKPSINIPRSLFVTHIIKTAFQLLLLLELQVIKLFMILLYPYTHLLVQPFSSFAFMNFYYYLFFFVLQIQCMQMFGICAVIMLLFTFSSLLVLALVSMFFFSFSFFLKNTQANLGFQCNLIHSI